MTAGTSWKYVFFPIGLTIFGMTFEILAQSRTGLHSNGPFFAFVCVLCLASFVGNSLREKDKQIARLEGEIAEIKKEIPI